MVAKYKVLLCKINVLTSLARIFKMPNLAEKLALDQEQANLDPMNQPLLAQFDDDLRISYLGGTIKKTEQMSMKKMIFRATRGKAYVHFFPVEIRPQDRMRGINDHNEKLVYIVMFEGGGFIKDKVQRICSSCTYDPV